MDVKSVIRRYGHSLESVGRLMQPPVTKSFLSQSLKRNPTVETLHRVAAALGCPVTEFFDDEVPAPAGRPHGLSPLLPEVCLDDATHAPLMAYVDFNGEVVSCGSLGELEEVVREARAIAEGKLSGKAAKWLRR